jgi:tRNA A-37 threonylcarbamoyl transferase component Bud32
MPSKAMAEAWGLNEMAAVGCRTPELLALGERRLLGNVRAACVVTRAIENAVSLADFAEQQRELRRTNPQQWSHWIKQISAQLIPQMQAMHRAGLYHYDLKWRNLLLVQHGSDCEIHLIDCPRARRHRWRRFRGQVVDLSALSRLAITHLSQHQRLRFLLQYLGKNYNRNHARKLLKAVNAHLSRRPPAGW